MPQAMEVRKMACRIPVGQEVALLGLGTLAGILEAGKPTVAR